jgi:hypothetical protein
MEFSKNLFWDTDSSRLDFDLNVRSIIARVVEWGTMEDWYLILDYFGINRLRQESVEIRSLEPKAHSFLSTVLDIPLENFRCYKEQQSYPELYHF